MPMHGEVAKVKGTNLIGAVKVLRKNRAHAVNALPPALHHYLEERIILTEWYPEEDLVMLMRAMAPLLRDAKEDPYELFGRAAVRDHLAGVYERLLKGDRASLARRVSVMWQAQHDTGALEFIGHAAGRGRYELKDYAHPSREMCRTLTGYLSESLRASGFESVELDKMRCVLDGHDRCVWECRWHDGTGAKR
jgi:hypothetical protein